MEIDIDISDLINSDEVQHKKILQRINDMADEYSIREAFKELQYLFDQMIIQYYHYETLRYTRHGEAGPGTRHGTNLFRSYNFNLHDNGDQFNITLEINGKRMDGYKAIGANQSQIQTTFVVDTILSGYRPMPPWADDFQPFAVVVTSPHLGRYCGSPDIILQSQKLLDALRKYRQEIYEETIVSLLSKYNYI